LEASKRVLRRNRADFELTRNRRAEAAERRSARRRLIIRRRKAYRRIRQIEQQAVKKLRRSKHRRSLLDFLDRDPDCAPGDSL
jgi:spore coat polysaccharide biosynthesis protein SpsF (cytidylyltransferase family)